MPFFASVEPSIAYGRGSLQNARKSRAGERRLRNGGPTASMLVLGGGCGLLQEIIFRFVVGGAVVACFSVVGGLFKQRSFAGLFAAAPSVALATLLLTLRREGATYASVEARSMIAGAAGFCVYACAVTLILERYRTGTLRTASACLLLWLATSLGLWFVFLR